MRSRGRPSPRSLAGRSALGADETPRREAQAALKPLRPAGRELAGDRPAPARPGAGVLAGVGELGLEALRRLGGAGDRRREGEVPPVGPAQARRRGRGRTSSTPPWPTARSGRSRARPPAEKPLVLAAEGPGEGVRRVTLTIPNENRFLLLLESQPTGNRLRPARRGRLHPQRGRLRGRRVRAGLHRHRGAGDDPGHATRARSYHVCCSGCRDLFNKDPAAIIAEAAERQKAKGK